MTDAECIAFPRQGGTTTIPAECTVIITIGITERVGGVWEREVWGERGKTGYFAKQSRQSVRRRGDEGRCVGLGVTTSKNKRREV